MATSYRWVNPNGGSFDNAANWSPNGVPGAGDSGTFDIGGTYVISGNGSAGYLLIDDDVTFTGTIDATQVSGQFTDFQVGGGGSATFNGGELDSAAETRIGDNTGSGSLSFINGATGTLTASDTATALDVAFADETGVTTTGTVTVDGDGSSLTLLGGAYIGVDGAGTLNISNLGSVQVDLVSVGYTSFEVGEGSGSNGLVNVDGGTLDVGEYTVIGDGGQGTVDFSNGATGSFAGAYYDTASGSDVESFAVYLGGHGGSGTLSVDGAGTNVTAHNGVLVGEYGNGVMSVTNGGTFTVDGTIGDPTTGSLDVFDESYLGYFAGSSGTLTVSNSSVFNDNGLLIIGAAGYGSIDIESGGTVVSNELSGDISGALGGNVGGMGVGTIDNGLWDAKQSFAVGDQGTGILTVQNNGTLEVDGTFLRVARDPGSNGTLTVDHATVAAANADLTVGPAATNPGDGTGGTGLLTIENAGTVTVDDALVGGLAGGTGSIDIDSGELDLNGNLSTGAGSSTITVDNGGIFVNGSVTIGGGGGDALLNLTDFGGLYDYGSGITVAALGTLELDATAYLDTADNTTTVPVVLNGGTLDVVGDGTLRNHLAVEVTGGSATNPSAIVGAAGSDVVIAGGVTFDGTADSVLLLGQGFDTNNVINGFGAGDTLDVRITSEIFDSATYDVNTDLLTLYDSTDNQSLSLHLTDNGYNADSFDVVADNSGGSYVYLESESPCYCPGTMILTSQGEVPVEALKAGDSVVTLKGGNRAIKWIGQRSYAGRFILGRKDVLPICIEAGALADNIPSRDLWVSPHHAMYLDGILIETKDLLNGISIYQADYAEQVDYYHVELDSHDVILAEGAWAESYLDDDNRGMFHNAADYRLLHADEVMADRRYYAPRLDSGHEVEAVRSRIEKRAQTSARKLERAV